MLWFVLFGVGMGLYFVGMPKNIDDYWYMNSLRDWYVGQGVLYPENGGNIFKYGIPFDGIMEIWKEHWVNDNTRLGNLIAPFLLLGPKWLWSGMMTVIWFVAIYLLGKFAGVDMRRSPLVLVLLSMSVIYFPWSEPFGGLVFQINYIPPTLFSVILLSAYFKENGHTGLQTLIGMFFLGFVTSWWHEGFGAPIGVGVIAVMLLYKRYRSKQSACIVLGLLAGGLIMLLSPVAHEKANAFNIGFTRRGIVESTILWTTWSIAFLLGILAGIRVGFRRVWLDPRVVFGVISSVVSFIIMRFTDSPLRSVWWYIVMACFCTVYFLDTGFKSFWSCYRVRNILITSPLSIACLVYLGSAGYVALQMREDIERGFYDGIEYPQKSRFCRYASISDLPWTSGYLPFSPVYTHNFYDAPVTWARTGMPSVRYLAYFCNDGYRGGIPERLRYVTQKSGEAVEGNRGVRNLDGSLFMKATAEDIKPFEENNVIYVVYRTRVGFGKGYGIADVQGVLFRSEGDGRSYIYLRPRFNWYVSHFKRLRHMDILDMIWGNDKVF